VREKPPSAIQNNSIHPAGTAATTNRAAAAVTGCCAHAARLIARTPLAVAVSGVALAWFAAVPCALRADAGEGAPESRRPGVSMADLSLEQLANIEVTSVLRSAGRLSDAAAAVYVITADDIRRSGATRLADVLRLAPNLEVARADADQYAITARGFDSVLANKLLVMIDGRVIYSPLFSGVFWEAQNLPVQNIERIEVVSGSGGTMWGTNAVNGVINIITRPSEANAGPLVAGGYGSGDASGVLRYGGGMGAAGSWSVTTNVGSRRHSERANDTGVRDADTDQHLGTRADWAHGPHELLLEADAYRADIEQVPGVRRLTGADVLGRWARKLGGDASVQLQAYYDFTGRDQPGAIHENLHTFDVDAQHRLHPARRQDLLWGAAFRVQDDRVDNLNPAALALLPGRRTLHFGNLFVQDQVAFDRALTLLAGARLEHNDYTHFEYLPSVRLAWKPHENDLLWGGASRAVRAPSRVDREFFIPGTAPHFALDGGAGFRSEIAGIFEAGYRTQATAALSFSVTAFHHHYDRLRSLEPGPAGPVFGNTLKANNTGLEMWGSYRVHERWRLAGGMVQQKQHRYRAAGSRDLTGPQILGNDPSQWFTLRSSYDFEAPLEWDVMAREVGPLPSPRVPGYVAVDTRVGWTLWPGFEVSVTGQNLFAPHHPEWGANPNRAVLERAVFGAVEWRP